MHNPAVRPEDYPDDSAVPVDAMHIVVCATGAMFGRLVHADGLGLDTKWRTNELGGFLLGCAVW